MVWSGSVVPQPKSNPLRPFDVSFVDSFPFQSIVPVSGDIQIPVMLSLYTNEPRCNRCVYTNTVARYSPRLIRIDKARLQPRGAMPRNTDQRREFSPLYRPGKMSYNIEYWIRRLNSNPPQAQSSNQLRTAWHPPRSGWSNTEDNQCCNSLLLFSRKLDRYFARETFGGSGGMIRCCWR